MKRNRRSLQSICVLAAVACAAALAGVRLTAQAPGPVAPQVTGWLSSVTTPADIVVVVDESGGLTVGELAQVRNLVRSFVGSQEVGAAVRMALVGFGATARQISPLSDSLAALQTATGSIVSSGPDRCLQCGIAMADQILTATGRADVAHVIVAIGRGASTAGLGQLAATAAQAQVGATIVAIGLNGFAQSELDAIASPVPGIQTVFTKPDVTAATDVAAPLSLSVAGILDELPLAADATCDTPARLDLELQGYNSTTQAPIDIVLVLDESGSIDSGEFAQLRQFASSLVNSFTFGPTATQVGIVTFSTNAVVRLGLTPSKTTALNAINGIVQRGGSTCIPCGFQSAMTVFGNPPGGRANVNRFVILLTDGVNNVNTAQLPATANALKALPSTVIGLGVGNGVDLAQLQSVVSNIPGVQTLFLPQDFSALATVIDTLVSLISAPAVQNVSVTVDLAAPFSFTGTPIVTSGVVTNDATSATWTLGSLGADLQRLRMGIQTAGRQGGSHQAIAGITYTDNDGNILSFGNATYNIRGCPAVMSLDPPTATNYVDEAHTVTATVLDDFNDPVLGETVDFAVSAGPNTGTSGSASTEAGGQASFTWSNAGGPGTDTVDASLPNKSGVTAQADKTWRLRNEPPVADAGTDETVNLNGSPQASVTLDGTGSTDDGALQPLSYSWSEGATPLGSGATLAVSLPIGTHTITLVVDDGELSDSDEVVITVVDPTPPVITPDVSGPAGNAGWYVGDVNVSWTVSDPESDVTSQTGCDPSIVSTDTAGETVTCEATSAGGTSSVSTTVKRDATPPDVTATPDRGADAGPWYNHALTVTFSGTDALSGIASCDPAAVYAGPDTGATSVSGACEDEAGNAASASYGLAYDATPPALAPVVTPNPVTLGGAATASANATDATSGVAAASCGPVVTTTIGTFQVACTATDAAGNSATVSTPYSVGYALCALFDTTRENRSGSTIPIRVQLCDASGAVAPPAGVTLTAVAVEPGGLAAEDAGKANPGGLFRYDDGVFIFNLKTRGFPSGSFGLEVSVSGDPTPHVVPFVIR